MMINGATEIATIALRHEFGELCPILCADETRAKEKKDRCDRDLSPGICCSELIDSWAVSAALASRPLERLSLQNRGRLVAKRAAICTGNCCFDP